MLPGILINKDLFKPVRFFRINYQLFDKIIDTQDSFAYTRPQKKQPLIRIFFSDKRFVGIASAEYRVTGLNLKKRKIFVGHELQLIG